MQYYTTIEQSRKLMELGLNPDTADMFWQSNLNNSDRQYLLNMGEEEYFDIEMNFEHCSIGDYDIPCWSLGTLMDLLPPSIQTGEGMQNHYEIDIRKYWGNEENLYQIAYGNNIGLSEEWHDMINTGEKENLIDAVFQMVCWLLENGYIKKGE